MNKRSLHIIVLLISLTIISCERSIEEEPVPFNPRSDGMSDVNEKLNGLPTISITTDNNVDITSKEVYLENTQMHIVLPDSSLEYDDIIKIKGRGNSSWAAPKKGYSIKLNKKHSIFGFPEDKSWVLIPNSFDPTLMRNDVGMFIGRELSQLDYTPRFCFVKLEINGHYKGVYQFGEKLKMADGRVTPSEGYLFEVDSRAVEEKITGDSTFFYVQHLNRPIAIKDPNIDSSMDEFTSITGYFNDVDIALFKGECENYIDLKSFAEWYVIVEISKEADLCAFFSSCYMNLDKIGGRIKMGPLWDMDRSFAGYPEAGISYNDYEGFGISKGSTWIRRMLQNPIFLSQVRNALNRIYSERSRIYKRIDDNTSLLLNDIYSENAMYGKICNKTATDDEVKVAYQKKVADMKEWIECRFEWLKSNIDNIH